MDFRHRRERRAPVRAPNGADDTLQQCGIFTEKTPTVGCGNDAVGLVGKVMNRNIRPPTGTVMANLLWREIRTTPEILDSILAMNAHDMRGRPTLATVVGAGSAVVQPAHSLASISRKLALS